MNVREIKATKHAGKSIGLKVERKRVAAYCRVSTNDEEQLNSYSSQKKHYTNLIQENREWSFAGVYADEAITGTQVIKRIDFQKLINDSLNGEIDMIITKSISRFARNTFDTLKYVRMLKEKNVAVYFEDENINTMTMDGELLLTILSSVAQQEVENISENVKKGLKMKMKRGELVGFHGCLGYDYHKDEKSLSVNEEEAEIVKYIFDRYVAGIGASIISKELNQKGILTKRGNLWTNGTIIGMIRNEKYIGDLLLGKTFTVDPISKRRLDNYGEQDKFYVKDHHQPIIDKEVFEKAQEILERRSYYKKPKYENSTREKYSRKYAFSSLLECGFCGATLSRRSWHSSSQYRKVIWHCSSYSKKGKNKCEHSKGVPEEIIEMAFLESYSMISGKDRDLVESFMKRLESTLGHESLKNDLIKQENKLDKIIVKKKKLLNLMLEDKIKKELFDESLFGLDSEERVLNVKIDELKIKLNNENGLKTRIENLKNALGKGIKLETFDRQIFESLIEKVIVGNVDEDGNLDPYNIKFIYKTGINNTINGEKHRHDGRRTKVDVLPLNSNDDSIVLSTNNGVDTR
jgi:DNA invertase Pin-like site-specific DNA recombinase